KYMAEKLHIKQQSYSRYELATGEPSLAILTEIAVIFNVSTDYLVGLSEI
ncbi:MAG: helix-turn-helix domain-containing protein, partial [Clostridia bacterium]|nr:helix-turn-helix domain-containing protein [Clostridia bacterium]